MRYQAQRDGRKIKEEIAKEITQIGSDNDSKRSECNCAT